jgi:hypothetical protein
VSLRSIYHCVYDGSVVQAAAVDRTLNTGGKDLQAYLLLNNPRDPRRSRKEIWIKNTENISDTTTKCLYSHIPLVLPYPCLIYRNVLIWQWVVWDLRLVLDREKTQRRFQGTL